MQKKLVTRNINRMSLNTKRILGLVISSLIGVIITFLLTVVISYTFSKSSAISTSIGAFFIAIVVFGSLISGLMSSRLTGMKGILSGFFSSIIFSFWITIIMLFFTGGHLAITTVVIYIGNILLGMVGGIVGANMKRKK